MNSLKSKCMNDLRFCYWRRGVSSQNVVSRNKTEVELDRVMCDENRL